MTIHATPTRRRMLALWLILALLLTACSSDDDDSSEAGEDSAGFATSDSDDGDGDGDGDDMAEEEADFADDDDAMAEEEPAEATQDGEAGGDPSLAQPTGLTAAELGRDIIFRAEIGVEVADVAAAGREATQRIEALGGVVFGQTTVTEPNARTVLTFKVAPADFDTALEQLSGVGELVDQTITADDVTARVVDLESRILTAETSVERLREFLAGATTVEDVAALERELVDRETELESLRGELRTIRDQVALATITLVITEQGPEIAAADLDVITGLGTSIDDACPGAAELETARDDRVVWCVEIENVGDAPLIDIELTSNALGLRTRDFTVVDGSLEELAPGAIARATVELDIEDGRVRRRNALGGLRIDVVTRANPADNVERTLTAERSNVIIADDEEGIPGFTDSFRGGVDVLIGIGQVALLILGAVLPFVPLLLLALLVGRVVRRRQTPAPTIEE